MKTKATKDNILQSAIKLFAKHGFVGTSTRSIAQDSGANLSMIHYYFTNKEGLYQAILSQITEAIDKILCDVQQADLNSTERIKQYASKVNKVYSQNRHYFQIGIMELSHPTKMGDFTLRAQMQKVNEFITKALRDGIENNEFRNDIDIANMTFCLAGILNFYFTSYAFYASKSKLPIAPSASYINNAIDIYLHGIVKSNLTPPHKNHR